MGKPVAAIPDKPSQARRMALNPLAGVFQHFLGCAGDAEVGAEAEGRAIDGGKHMVVDKSAILIFCLYVAQASAKNIK